MNANLHPKVISELEILERITDQLGMPIDEDIRLLVSVLRALNFHTTSSCSGHIDKSYPYVDISSITSEKLKQSTQWQEIIDMLNKDFNNSNNLETYDKLSKEIREESLKEGFRLLGFLNTFYSTRQVPAENRIIIEPIGEGLGGIRLYPQKALFINLMSKNARIEWLKSAQDEMDAFAYFLSSKIK